MVEILITLKSDSAPRPVSFSDLYVIRNDLHSIMLLWDTNCYYATIDPGIFMINGGRRFSFEELPAPHLRIFYRKRTLAKMVLGGDDLKDTEVFWIIGLESIETGATMMLKISEDGSHWEWVNKL